MVELHVMIYHQNHQCDSVRLNSLVRVHRAVIGSCRLRAALNSLGIRQAGGRTHIKYLTAWCLCLVPRCLHR